MVDAGVDGHASARPLRGAGRAVRPLSAVGKPSARWPLRAAGGGLDWPPWVGGHPSTRWPLRCGGTAVPFVPGRPASRRTGCPFRSEPEPEFGAGATHPASPLRLPPCAGPRRRASGDPSGSGALAEGVGPSAGRFTCRRIIDAVVGRTRPLTPPPGRVRRRGPSGSRAGSASDGSAGTPAAPAPAGTRRPPRRRTRRSPGGACSRHHLVDQLTAQVAGVRDGQARVVEPVRPGLRMRPDDPDPAAPYGATTAATAPFG